jgi:hypothetical protein
LPSALPTFAPAESQSPGTDLTASPIKATIDPGIPTLTPSETATLQPTFTPVLLVVREPTPTPVSITLVQQGFGQVNTSASYAFVVSNPNQSLLAMNGHYQVALFDSSGTVIATANDTLPLIGPQQQVGVAEDVSIPGGVQVSRIEVQIREGSYVEGTQLQQLPVENIALFTDNQKSKITAQIRNPNRDDIINLPVICIAYDGTGIIGGGRTLVPFIPAQGQAPVEFAITTSQTPNRVEIYPLVAFAPPA